jgi:hypothetical protein
VRNSGCLAPDRSRLPPALTVETSPARGRSSDLRDLGEEVGKVLVNGSFAEGVLIEDCLDTISPASKVPEALADRQVDLFDV